MPYDYYSLPFCSPDKVTTESENIGEIMSGDRIENSIYAVEMKVSKPCAVACSVKLTRENSAAFKHAINEEYRAHWIIDNLPVGTYETSANGEKVFSRGYPVGFVENVPSKVAGSKGGKAYIYNHIRIILQVVEFMLV